MKNVLFIGFIFSIFTSSAQVKIFSDLSYGGPKEGGAIFSFEPGSQTFEHLYNPSFISFMASNYNSVVRANNGKFYGVGVMYQPMAYELAHKGKIFEYDPATGEYKVVSFIDSPALPTSHSAYNRPIVYDEVNNVLYTNNNKAIYKYDIDNEEGEVIFEFENSSNNSEFNIVFSHGKIWGTKKLQPNINSFVLYSLDLATLTEEIYHTETSMRYLSVHDGVIYGTRASGFFMYDIANDEVSVVNEYVVGNQQMNQAVRVDNKVYCTARQGGNNNAGTLKSYDFDTQQWSTLLHLDNQNSGVLGGDPGMSLIHKDGFLYFSTRNFGDSPVGNKGTFLKFNLSNNTVTKILDNDTADVHNWGVLYYDDVDDALYGMSQSGGPYFSGRLFSLELQNESLSVLLNSREFVAGDGYPIGVSAYGNGKITGIMSDFLFDTLKVYEYDMAGNTLSIVHGFTSENWTYSPKPNLTPDYFTFNTEENGQNTINILDFNTHQISTHDWSHPTVNTPRFVIYDENNVVYLISEEGGAHDAGAVLKLDISNNQLSTVYEFTEDDVAWNNISGCQLDGAYLYVASSYVMNRVNIATEENEHLVELNVDTADETGEGFNSFTIADDMIYGIHQWGGSYNNGLIFSIDLNSNDYDIVYEFETSTTARPVHYFDEKLYFYQNNSFINFGIYTYDLIDNTLEFMQLNFAEHGYSGMGMMTIIDQCELEDYSIAQSGITLSLNLPSNAQIEWVNCDDETTILSTESNFTPTESGDYKAFISLSSCEVETDCIPVQLSNIDEYINEYSFGIYPNPASTSITISEIVEPSSITITDLNGRVMFTTSTNETLLQVDLDNYASGVYLVNVMNENYNISKRLMLK